MALTKCKDCGQEISKKAKACPACGAPVGKTGRLDSSCGGNLGSCLGLIILAVGIVILISIFA